MKMARPRPEDFDKVTEFFSVIEEFFEYGTLTGGEETAELSDEQFVEHLRALWGGPFSTARVDAAWRRVVFGGQIAIDNACDVTLPHLDFKPEIKTAVESYTAARDDG